MADPVPHLTAFGWPVDITSVGFARPLTELVVRAAELIGWKDKPVPGTLVFDAIAQGIYKQALPQKVSDEHLFWAGVKIAVSYWKHCKPWTRDPPEGFREPNFDMFTAECEALENRGENVGRVLHYLVA